MKFVSKLRFILFYFFLGCYLPMFADELILCRQVAKDILKTDTVEIKLETSGYFVLTPLMGSGYVVVSKNRNNDIIGYSKESVWDEDGFPTILREWLNACGKKDSLDTDGVCNYKAKIARKVGERNSVYPLITTHWTQKSPYNNYTPVIEDGNIKTAAGCVAIAAAQITYYWWRDNPYSTLMDTPVYPYGGAPVTYSIPQGTPNDWELIKNKYSSEDSEESRDAVARLCYVIGTTSYLNYASSTGGHINDAARAMYSQYNLISDYLSKNKCDYDEWEQLLFDELSSDRPVMCSGTGSGGHAFVLDGYDSTTGLFHFNFGWGGSGDGYYLVDDSEYAMGGYNEDQAIVYNIHPEKRNIKAEISVTQTNQKYYNLKVNIINDGTLPVSVRLISSNNDELTVQDSETFWQSVINNDNVEVTEDVTISMDKLGTNLKLSLVDEYDSHICDCTLDPSGIDDMSMLKEDYNKKIYGIDGRCLKEVGNTGVYILQEGYTNKKIMIK